MVFGSAAVNNGNVEIENALVWRNVLSLTIDQKESKYKLYFSINIIYHLI